MQAELRNVLVLDDDERILGMYKRCFDSDWKVHSASTTAEALALAQAVRMDAAVLDLHIGTQSSIPLLRVLRAARPQIRIMVVSGYLTTETTVIAVRSGADVVADKPIRPKEVMRRLFGDMPQDVDSKETPTLEDAIESHIARVYADCDGNVSETARRLGIYRSSLQRRLRRTSVKRIA